MIVILGAGFAGHTAALHLSHLVKGKADVTVVAPRNRFTWFPSLIWVGIGAMPADEVSFRLSPVYERLGIEYVDGRATTTYNIADQIADGAPHHHARMSEMPAACIASMGKSLWSGSAASIIMTPVVRDFAKYPEYGRDLRLCDLDVGVSGAWTKRLLHSAFMWKLQAKPGWQLIPE